MTGFQSRDEVKESEKWQLKDIYPSMEEWNKDYTKAAEMTEKLSAYEGKLEGSGPLFDYLTFSEELGYIYKKLYVFAMLQADLDTRDSASQALLEKAGQLGRKIGEASSFFMPYLLSLDEAVLRDYISEKEGLQYFEDDLYDSFRYKSHVLSKEQEALLSQLSAAFGSPQKTFGMINNADIKFGEVTNTDGEKVELTRGMYSKLIESPDREVRKEAYKAYYQPYLQLKNTIASTLSAAIRNNTALAKARNYPSALEKSLFGDQVPLEVYENLIKATKENIGPMHEYVKLRKKILGLDELHQYDLSVPLVADAKEDISYDEAFDIMLKALRPLGEDYIFVLSGFREKRWIDVRETPGKRSGAYNLGLYGVHPFILLNHQDDLDSLFTLVHECGHGMHSYYSSKYQPQISAGYSIFVAEVASTVNEILLIRYLLKTTEDSQKKKHLINHFIDGFKGTFFTQVMFSEFEKIAHEKAEKDEALTTEVFNEIYQDLFVQYNGPEVVLDEEVKYGWSRIPHFYRHFYVYKYATGYASAITIADRILSGDQEALSSYQEFLQSGSSEYPLDLLKKAGVDLTKPETIKHAMDIFKGLVDEFAELTR